MDRLLLLFAQYLLGTRKVGPGAGGQRGCLTRGYHGVTTTPWMQSVDRTGPPRGMIGNLAPMGWDRGCFSN
ncbi:hypothetical protein ASPBRDRAFT_44767 [Aspergillus brasiliensis CBS 101740]|uniref:Uncharacterized protein n=1 Tax=Aspergillus brasiliensis (strain CBS 101740 / IMI 381727 / IBT 21946) TaxID=767769 RepID=A0A1L9UFY3_ASPBC|nr:hypothetical protein ASPBRDRAFT_44767 [Aspergillus brasiliensis CBS 101740]